MILKLKSFSSGGGQPSQPITAQKCNEYPVTSVAGKTGAVTLTASDAGAVPTSRTVNGKPLNSNITLTKSDVSLGNVDNVRQYSINNGPKVFRYTLKNLIKNSWFKDLYINPNSQYTTVLFTNLASYGWNVWPSAARNSNSYIRIASDFSYMEIFVDVSNGENIRQVILTSPEDSILGKSNAVSLKYDYNMYSDNSGTITIRNLNNDEDGNFSPSYSLPGNGDNISGIEVLTSPTNQNYDIFSFDFSENISSRYTNQYTLQLTDPELMLIYS